MTVEMINRFSGILALFAVCFIVLAIILFFSFQIKKTFQFAFLRKKTNRNVEKTLKYDVMPEKETLQTTLLDTVQLPEDELVQDEKSFEMIQDISFTYRNQ